MTYQISVVVPTFKRPDLLKQCLAALLAQDLDPAAYEIIIVDDAACNETRRQVETLAEQACTHGNTLRYLPNTQKHGPAAARNVGWRAACGEIIAFTDDDCLPTPQWLSAGLKAFQDEIVGVSGKILVPLAEIPTDYERNAAHLETAEFATANCFYLREALCSLNGFDERFTVAWREDSDLVFRLLECKAKLAFAPEAIVVHPVRSAPWGISIRQQRKSSFNALLYKKHPALYRERIQATPPWHYYCIVASLLIALTSIPKRSGRLRFAATAIWLLLTGRFYAQRLCHTSRAPLHIAEMLFTSFLIPPLAIFWRIRGAIKFRVFFL